jgi:signal transduction histidine kinase
VQNAAVRSVDLTRQLLTFSRRQAVAPVVLDLNETITRTRKMLQRLIGEEIDFRWRPAADLWPISADPTQLDQILANLCVNARDAVAGVGIISVETGNRTIDETGCAAHAGCVPGEYVLLTVSDNGCGMDTDTLSHLYEPFFTTKAEGKGTGLGLATVYGIVKQSNGFIGVCSQPGLGTTFSVYLPRHSGQASDATVGRARHGPRACETR